MAITEHLSEGKFGSIGQEVYYIDERDHYDVKKSTIRSIELDVDTEEEYYYLEDGYHSWNPTFYDDEGEAIKLAIYILGGYLVTTQATLEKALKTHQEALVVNNRLIERAKKFSDDIKVDLDSN